MGLSSFPGCPSMVRGCGAGQPELGGRGVPSHQQTCTRGWCLPGHKAALVSSGPQTGFPDSGHRCFGQRGLLERFRGPGGRRPYPASSSNAAVAWPGLHCRQTAMAVPVSHCPAGLCGAPAVWQGTSQCLSAHSPATGRTSHLWLLPLAHLHSLRDRPSCLLSVLPPPPPHQPLQPRLSAGAS